MKHPASLLVLISTLIVVAGAAYFLGYRSGWKEALLSDAIPRGVLALGQLRSLQAEKREITEFQLQGHVEYVQHAGSTDDVLRAMAANGAGR